MDSTLESLTPSVNAPLVHARDSLHQGIVQTHKSDNRTECSKSLNEDTADKSNKIQKAKKVVITTPKKRASRRKAKRQVSRKCACYNEALSEQKCSYNTKKRNKTVCTWGKGNGKHGWDFVASNPKQVQTRWGPLFVTQGNGFAFRQYLLPNQVTLKWCPLTFIGKPSTKFVRF